MFRRQHAIGPYIADFFCAAANLVVEIDGWDHAQPEQLTHDVLRDAYLRNRGLDVVRIAAAEIMADPDGIALSLFETAVARTKSP